MEIKSKSQERPELYARGFGRKTCVKDLLLFPSVVDLLSRTNESAALLRLGYIREPRSNIPSLTQIVKAPERDHAGYCQTPSLHYLFDPDSHEQGVL